MAGNVVFREPALKSLDGEPPENLVRTITKMVERGDLDPAKFNMVLEQVRETNCQALVVIENNLEIANVNPDLPAAERDKQHLELLEDRFLKNMHRHAGVDWDLVAKRHKSTGKKQRHALLRMERTEGQPDVYRYDFNRNRVMFFDFSPESPKGRRNLSYDAAIEMASDMGVRIATPDIYMGAFGINPMDNNSHNWVKTSFWRSLLGKANVAYTQAGYKGSKTKEILEERKDDYSPNRGFRSYLVF